MNLLRPLDIHSFLGYEWDPPVDAALIRLVTAQANQDDFGVVDATNALFEELCLRRGIYE